MSQAATTVFRNAVVAAKTPVSWASIAFTAICCSGLSVPRNAARRGAPPGNRSSRTIGRTFKLSSSSRSSSRHPRGTPMCCGQASVRLTRDHAPGLVQHIGDLESRLHRSPIIYPLPLLSRDRHLVGTNRFLSFPVVPVDGQLIGVAGAEEVVRDDDLKGVLLIGFGGGSAPQQLIFLAQLDAVVGVVDGAGEVRLEEVGVSVVVEEGRRSAAVSSGVEVLRCAEEAGDLAVAFVVAGAVIGLYVEAEKNERECGCDRGREVVPYATAGRGGGAEAPFHVLQAGGDFFL